MIVLVLKVIQKGLIGTQHKSEVPLCAKAYGVWRFQISRTKEHGSRWCLGAGRCHQPGRKERAELLSPSKVRLESVHALWRSMFLHFALVQQHGHGAAGSHKRCAHAAQHALMARSTSAELGPRARTSPTLGTHLASRGLPMDSISACPQAPASHILWQT